MRKLSLFSGIGGIDLAAHWAGMETVAFCEREPFPQRVLRKNFPSVPIYDDVCTLTREVLERDQIIRSGASGAIDLISAGYPCQPFSTAGQRRGKADDRHLWPEVARIVQEIRPRWFVGENVAGHIALGLDDVLDDLEGIGYTTQAFVIPASAICASHQRARVFILGYTEHDGSYGTTVRRGFNSAGDNNPDGSKLSSQLTRAGRSGNHAIMADTASIGQPKSRESIPSSNQAEDSGRQTSQSINASIQPKRTTQCRLGRSADEPAARLDRRGIAALDALTDFVHSYPQPALMHQPQYDWEPPRVATGIKNRTARLKAIGNAVDPLQIYPILAAIKFIDDQL